MLVLNIIFYIPLTLYRLIQAWLFPRALFRYTYAPSSEAERNRSVATRNQIRLVEYKIKRALHND